MSSCPACGEGYPYDPIADDTAVIRVFVEDLEALREHLPERVDIYVGTSDIGVGIGDRSW